MSKRWSRAAALVATVVLVVPMLACGAGAEIEEAEQAARTFCGHLAADRMEDAWALTHEDLRGTIAEADFVSMLRRERGVVGHTTANIESTGAQVGVGSTPTQVPIAGTLEGPMGVRRIRLTMRPRGEGWAVAGLTVEPVAAP